MEGPSPKYSMGSTSSIREKLLALEELQHNPSRWSTLPWDWKRDKEFVLTVLKYGDELPCKSEFERLFPTELQCDEDVVLAFSARPDFVSLYYDRMLYVPDCFKDNKRVMMAYCAKIPRSLQECSERLCGDYEVVRTALEQDGMELQYASRHLQSDESLVRLACRSRGRALEFCPPGPLLDALTRDRAFMLMALKSEHSGPAYRLIRDPSLQRDREIVLMALVHGLRWRFCPLELQQDMAFVLTVVGLNPALYLELPKPVRLEEDVARRAVLSAKCDTDVMRKVLSDVPVLAREKEVFLAIAHRAELSLVLELFQLWSGAFRSDKEVMLAVLRRDQSLFSECSLRLREDPDVISAAMNASTALELIKSTRSEVLELHPVIFVNAINLCSGHDLDKLSNHVTSAFVWSHREVALAFIRRGRCSGLPFSAMISTDAELALEVAEHCWHDFGIVGMDLRESLEFMQCAVERNGFVFRFAGQELRHDMGLATRAVASTASALSTEASSETVSNEALQKYLEGNLDLYKTFLYDFLAGIAANRLLVHPSRISPLTLLDRGTETTQALKRSIADFLGVPQGTELARIRKAFFNLKNYAPGP